MHFLAAWFSVIMSMWQFKSSAFFHYADEKATDVAMICLWTCYSFASDGR